MSAGLRPCLRGSQQRYFDTEQIIRVSSLMSSFLVKKMTMFEEV